MPGDVKAWKRFEEVLGRVQLPAQVVGGIVVEKPSPPELKAGLERLPGEHQPLDPRIYRLLKLLDRLFPALRHKLRHARCQFQQLEERRQRGDVPRFRTFDVLEADEVGQRRGGKRRDIGRVELPAGNGKHQIAGVDEARQQDDHPVRLQAIRARRHVLDVVNGVDQLAPVENLSLALVGQQLDDMLRVARATRVEPVSVEQLQCIEDPGSLLRLARAGDPAQRVLDRLRTTLTGPIDRKRRVPRRFILEARGQRRRTDGIHDVQDVDLRPFGRRLALHPPVERLRPSLVRHLDRGGHVPPATTSPTRPGSRTPSSRRPSSPGRTRGMPDRAPRRIPRGTDGRRRQAP